MSGFRCPPRYATHSYSPGALWWGGCGRIGMAAHPSGMETEMRHTFLALVVLFASMTVEAQQALPRVYIEASETVDASNSKDEAKHVDFGSAISAALVKKKTPVVVVTDLSKAQWTIRSVSSQREDSTGTKVAKMAFLGAFSGGFTKFEGTFQVIDNESTELIYAYNVKKGNFQSAAEAFAEHFKDDYLQKRK